MGMIKDQIYGSKSELQLFQVILAEISRVFPPQQVGFLILCCQNQAYMFSIWSSDS